MNQFKVITDSTGDLPKSYLEEHHVGCISVHYIVDEIVYGGEKELEPKVFYQMMREGKMPTTSQVNPVDAADFLKEQLKDNKNLLIVGFSSGLSGSINNIRLAAQELMDENPDCDIRVVDSLAACMGEGLLTYKAVQLCEEGKTLDEATNWVEENKLHICHMFTVDDLFHLHRGGRVSKATAIVGTIANIKPVLHVDNEGHLINVDKVRGRKKSLVTLVDYMEKKMGNYREQNDMIMIAHGDSLEEAEFVKEEIINRFGITNIMINDVGPTIGAHTGPAIMALFFMGEER